MKNKRLMCGLLAGAMVLAMAGCGKTAGPGDVDEIGPDIPASSETVPEPTADRTAATEPVEDDARTAGDADGVPDEPAGQPGDLIIDTDINPNWFDDELQRFLEGRKDYGSRSYMVSPASFRAAMCLALEGSSGTTHDMLLYAAGFQDDDGMQRWYNDLMGRQMSFMERYEALKSESELWGDGSDPDMGFDLANAIWDNTAFPGGFRPDYADAVMKKYGATASESSAEDITADVNSWCDEKTHGMIKSISDDLSLSSSVLANALYVKSGWLNEFSEYFTEKGEFTKPDGSVFETDFMRQTDDFLYYESDSGKAYAVFGLEGDIWLTVCLDTGARVTDMMAAMYKARTELLDVKMSKLDMETSFDAGEFLDFLDHMDAGIARCDIADFSKMTDSPNGWHIDDIVQKTRIKTDEKGMEAAAVTAVMMADNAAVIDEPPVPIEFYMDVPFSFMITAGRNTSDSDGAVLFFGQYAG